MAHGCFLYFKSVETLIDKEERRIFNLQILIILLTLQLDVGMNSAESQKNSKSLRLFKKKLFTDNEFFKKLLGAAKISSTWHFISFLSLTLNFLYLNSNKGSK